MNKIEKISLISLIVLLGFIFSISACYFAQYMGLNYPFTSFLFNPKIAFQDFTNLLPLIGAGNPYTPPSTWQQYFPPAYIFLYPFTFLTNPLVGYFLFFSIFLGYFLIKNTKIFYCYEISKIANAQNILILTLISYPFLCLFDRGNFDLILFIFFSLFATQLHKEKYTQAAILLGILNSFKPFSIPFLLLFLTKKRFKEFFISILVSTSLILGGFLFFDKNILSQLIVMLQSWKYFSLMYVDDYSNYGLINSASIFPILKLKFCYYTKLLTTQQLGYWYNMLSLCVTIITVFLALKEKVFWKQLMLITLYMLLIPISVYDYKLIFLFIPLYFFVNEKNKSKFDKIYAILFGLLLIPKHYWIVPLDELNRLSISTWLTPFLMLVFAILIIWEMLRFRTK